MTTKGRGRPGGDGNESNGLVEELEAHCCQEGVRKKSERLSSQRTEKCHGIGNQALLDMCNRQSLHTIGCFLFLSFSSDATGIGINM
jgi:hypothetical protein